MANHNLFNIDDSFTREKVDRINKAFYGRFNYPWLPLMLPVYADADFWTHAVNQDIGDWKKKRVPEQPRIWVAGCGTNQAALTALKFPKAQVLGTDISADSLAVCQKIVEQTGIRNLTLEEKTLNESRYTEEFDYILCTGVIHHNAEPQTPLVAISRALKKSGILELMVYNYYHRTLTTAYQKAIRILNGSSAEPDIDAELSLTRALMDDFPLRNTMGDFLAAQKGSPEVAMADSLLQPVEYSYTIDSLAELAGKCDLVLLNHCINPFDRAAGRIHWNLVFGDSEVKRLYDALPDRKRWQISNLLMVEQSPMLWFYLQRRDASFPRKSEKEICDEFLKTIFRRRATQRRHFVLSADRGYEFSAQPIPFPAPGAPRDNAARLVFEAVDGQTAMDDLLRQAHVDASFSSVNPIRLMLTTSAFPYLEAM